MNALNTENWQWAELKQQGDNPTEGRQGLSLNSYKNSLVLFGGERKYNKNVRIRECYSDCRIFNLSTQQWTLVRQYGDFLESRRNNLSCMLGKFLIIIGGVDSNGKYLNDICSINLETNKASRLEQTDGYESGIAFSACCAVFKNEVKVESLYVQTEKQQTKGAQQPQTYQQGIYVFGGRKENGDAIDSLRILQIGKKPLKWIDPDIQKGKPPQARFSHTMNYYKEFNSLVVIGGRNEVYYSLEGSNIFQDVHILSLEFQEWIKVDVKGSGVPSRCSHTATIMDTKIIIFGGISNNGICSSDLLILELDQRKVNAFQKEHNQRVLFQNDKKIVNSEHLQHKFSIEGIMTNDNYLFQVPQTRKFQRQQFQHKTKISQVNYQRHQQKKETTFENSKEQEVSIEADEMKHFQQSQAQQVTQTQQAQQHTEFDRVYNNRYEGVKTFLPLPLLPKRSTLHLITHTNIQQESESKGDDHHSNLKSENSKNNNNNNNKQQRISLIASMNAQNTDEASSDNSSQSSRVSFGKIN